MPTRQSPQAIIVADAIFLVQALQVTRETYAAIYPQKIFETPKLSVFFENLTNFYPFPSPRPHEVHIHLFESAHFPLEGHFLELPVHHSQSRGTAQNLHWHRHPCDFVAVEILFFLEKFSSENTATYLLANDLLLSASVGSLSGSMKCFVPMTLDERHGGQLFGQGRWADVMYPMALSLGLARHEV